MMNININSKGAIWLSLYFSFLMMVLSSCNTKKAYEIPEKVLNTDSIYFHTQSNYSMTVSSNYFSYKDTMFLAILWRNSFYCDSVIRIYDIKNDKVAYKINLPYGNLRGIINPIFIHVYNLDSILVVFDGNFIGYDTSIVMINKSGKIIKNYNVENKYFKTSKNLEPDTPLYIYAYTSHIFYFDKICFSLRRYTNNNETLLPVVGYYDLKKENVVVCEQLKLKADVYYTTFIDSNLICISPKNSSKVYLWNIKTNFVYSKEMKSKLIDSLKLAKNIPFFDSEKELYKYLDVINFKEKKIFVRTLALPNNVFGSNFAIQLLYDYKFNYLGEIILNRKNSYLSINNPLISDERNKIKYYASLSEDETKIKLVKKEYIFKNWDILKAQKEINDSLLQYIKYKKEQFKCLINFKKTNKYEKDKLFQYIKNKLQIKENTFAIVCIRLDGCFHCNEFIYDFFSKNLMFLNQTNTYILLYNPYSANNNLLYKNFESLKTNHLIKENVVYPVIHPFSENNPRLILVKDNKIISDTIYMPDKQVVLIESLLKFQGFDLEIK